MWLIFVRKIQMPSFSKVLTIIGFIISVLMSCKKKSEELVILPTYISGNIIAFKTTVNNHGRGQGGFFDDKGNEFDIFPGGTVGGTVGKFRFYGGPIDTNGQIRSYKRQDIKIIIENNYQYVALIDPSILKHLHVEFRLVNSSYTMPGIPLLDSVDYNFIPASKFLIFPEGPVNGDDTTQMNQIAADLTQTMSMLFKGKEIGTGISVYKSN